MDIRDWTIALIEPNKYEAQIQLDLLKSAGVQRVRLFKDSADAMVALELYPANVVIMEIETPGEGAADGVEWTKQFRRNRRLHNRKAPIFLMSHAVSRALAENCRHAGANAIIGKPVSGSTLLATIKKVIANPRPFIDAEGYVGPCRRAGIVQAGAGSKRRKSDMTPEQAVEALPVALAALAAAAGDLIKERTTTIKACEGALLRVQQIAVRTGDQPMTDACGAFAALLANPGAIDDTFRASLKGCMDRLAQLVAALLEQAALKRAAARAAA